MQRGGLVPRAAPPPRESRTWAAVDWAGETGPFSWFSSSRKLRVIHFFQWWRGVVGWSLRTSERGSCCSEPRLLHGDRVEAVLPGETKLPPGDMVDWSSESEHSATVRRRRCTFL